MRTLLAASRFAFLAIAGSTMLLPGIAQQAAKPYRRRRIVEEKASVAAGILPVDPTIRVAYRYKGNMEFGASSEGKRLANNVATMFMIDGKVLIPKVDRG